MPALLPTKFYLPPLPAGFVARPQLLEKLDEALVHRLTLVSAPAGAGKTTQVSAWVQSVRKKGIATSWLSLDDADNAPERFLEYLIACLEEGGTAIYTAALAPGADAHEQGESLLADIIHGLINLERELILILDDYHLIQNPEIHAAVRYLLEHIPPRLHILLLTRSDPPLELARLRAAGQLVEVRMEQLRFSDQEAAALLKKSAGVQLPESDATALNNRAEGWAAGLQMAAISLRGRRDVSEFVAAFTGSHRYVFDYLLEQVLNHQTLEVRNFLLKTSVLERLSAPLCEAVAGADRPAGELLKILERENLFLIPLDDERSWFRYHHLFADLLKLMLEQSYPGLTKELHRRASQWYQAQDMIPEAMHHALAAGDMEQAARLVSANVLALVEHSELIPILMRIDAAPRESRQSLPWLGVAHAWALAYTGQMERAAVALALVEKRLEDLPGVERSQIAGHISAVQAYLAWVHGSQQEAVAYAEQASLLLPKEEMAVRALNLTTLGNALTQHTASQSGVDVLEQALSLARQAGQSHVMMLAASALAYAYSCQGRLHKAHAVCQEAIETSAAFPLRTNQSIPAAASIYAELSSIYHEWGDTAQAIQTARKGLALCEPWGQTDTIMLCLIHLANAYSQAQDFEAARQAVQRARNMAQKVSPWFVQNVDEVELKIWLDAEDTIQAVRTARAANAAIPPSLEARLLVRQNRFDEALSLAESSLPEARQTSSRELVRLGVIRSLVLYLKKEQQNALSTLKDVLEWAETENRIAAFICTGKPMEELLRLARAKNICPEFVQRLLIALEARRKPAPVSAVEPLIEPLSSRELEILQLLNGPLSTPEIAALSFVSANTIRTHIKSIYSKFGVHGRSAAVRRACELGLIH
ncbi:MAG: hypothetical protein JXB15_11740 [Anaerolineales bacterium]|nr:hypothetical protein [Anaerolineales bacterium]